MCRLQPSSPAPYVPLDTIVDSGRVLRRPLGEWARQLVTIIRSCAERNPEPGTIYQASAALNNAALVFVHAGLPQAAEEVCQSQLDWIESLRAMLPEAELAVLAMQPWVNLGRLCRRSRNYQRALSYFSELSNCRTGAAVRFGNWDAPASHTLRETAEPIYVYESMRTYQQADDLDGAIAFAHSLGQSMLRSTLMLRTELLIHIHLQRREPERVLTMTKTMPWPEDQYGVLARYLYLAIALEAVGQRQSCASALERIKPQLFTYMERQAVESRNIRLVIEACRLAAHLGLGELFAGMLSIGCSLVLRAEDIPFAVAILRLANLQGCSVGLDELAALTSRSGYSVPSCNLSSQTIAGEIAGLRSAISQLLCVPALA